MSNSLASLFAQNPQGSALPAAFRQAVLRNFDADDGSNTVTVGPATLTNLPLLVTGAEIGLEPGDNILIMYLGNSAMIVGKIATVGGPNYGSGNAGIANFNSSVVGYGITGGPSNLILSDGTIVAPKWANSAQITAVGTSAFLGTSNQDVLVTMQYTDSGGSFFSSGSFSSPSQTTTRNPQYVQMAAMVPVVPGAAITFKYFLGVNTTVASDPTASAKISGYLNFFRESVK